MKSIDYVSHYRAIFTAFSSNPLVIPHKSTTPRCNIPTTCSITLPMTSICPGQRSSHLPRGGVRACQKRHIYVSARTASATNPLLRESHSVPRRGGSSNLYSANLSSFHLIKVSCQLPIQIPSKPASGGRGHHNQLT